MAGEASNYPHLYLTYAAVFVQVSTQQISDKRKSIAGLKPIQIRENVSKQATSWKPGTTSI